MKYLAFDLEISKEIPEGATDWKAHRPLGISCAATWASNEDEPSLWCTEWCESDEYEYKSGYAEAMKKEDVCLLVEYMAWHVTAGYTIVTWNGLSFDFDILAEESGMHAECVQLAMNHVDMMFHFFALRGHYLGLDKAAKGAGLPGKLEGVNGAMAPILWQQGQYQTVLDYVAQDVRTTLDVAIAIEQQKRIRWTARSGRPNEVRIDRWLTVAEALELPEPDTSWMTDPVSRSQFTAWMEQKER